MKTEEQNKLNKEKSILSDLILINNPDTRFSDSAQAKDLLVFKKRVDAFSREICLDDAFELVLKELRELLDLASAEAIVKQKQKVHEAEQSALKEIQDNMVDILKNTKEKSNEQ